MQGRQGGFQSGVAFNRPAELRLDAGPGEEWNAGSLPLISLPGFFVNFFVSR
tara:strand:- start:69945 stop:70100 length:156 start_codon:yes stop_codon:yes gene_type:complete